MNRERISPHSAMNLDAESPSPTLPPRPWIHTRAQRGFYSASSASFLRQLGKTPEVLSNSHQLQGMADFAQNIGVSTLSLGLGATLLSGASSSY